MTYWASNGVISNAVISGGIAISEEQYLLGLSALTAGLEIVIIEDEMVLREPQPSPHHQWIDGEWVEKAPEPEPVTITTPDIISRRQFFQALADPALIETVTGSAVAIITEADALAAVQTGAIPTPLDDIIEQLPVEQQFSARMLVSGATEFNRYHSLSEIVRTSISWTPEQQDRFWRLAAQL